MKLRIKEASVRLRVDRRDLGQLLETGAVTSRTPFPSGAWLSCSLTSDANVEEIHAEFDANAMVVQMPADWIKPWYTSDRVGFEAQIATPHGPLKVLVEKDFACLAPREGEDDSHAYPHPEAGNPDATC